MHDYLVSFGVSGDFARFQGSELLERGDRVVIRGRRGLELGTVLRPASERLAGMLPDGAAGELLRRATAEDEALAERLRQRGRVIRADARRLAQELNLAVEVLEVEVPLDEHFAILQVLGDAGQPLVETLAERHDIAIAVHNLALPAAPAGCGKPDCGQGHGGCSSCSSGGGCGSGCGSPQMTRDVTEYFAGLRRQMESRGTRTPLL
jgi:hypothetical protein